MSFGNVFETHATKVIKGDQAATYESTSVQTSLVVFGPLAGQLPYSNYEYGLAKSTKVSGSEQFPETTTIISKTGFQPVAAIGIGKSKIYRYTAFDLDVEMDGMGSGVLKIGALFLEQDDGVVYETFGIAVMPVVSKEQ